MDFLQFLPLLSADKKVRSTIEGITGQPIDYVVKCLGSFVESLKSGPGIVDKTAQQQAIFNQMYNAGMSCGFKDYESIIAAAGFSGHSPIEVTTYLRNTFGWDNLNVEEVELLAKNIAPRFRQKLIQYGFLKPEESEPEDKTTIPKIKVSTNSNVPPWRIKTAPQAPTDKQQSGSTPSQTAQ